VCICGEIGVGVLPRPLPCLAHPILTINPVAMSQSIPISPSNIKIHNFTVAYNPTVDKDVNSNIIIFGQLIFLNSTLWLYLSNSSLLFNNLTAAICTQFDSQPAIAKIVNPSKLNSSQNGASVDNFDNDQSEFTSGLSSRLSKLFNISIVYISSNINSSANNINNNQDEMLFNSWLEKQVIEQLKANQDKLLK
jgi:hypothetical protein